MATRSWFAGWLLFLALLKITCCTSDQGKNCMALEIGGVRPTDKQIKIQKDSYINLTVLFHNASNCQNNNQDTILIALFKEGKDLRDGVCKFLLTTVCQTADSSNSTICQCLSPHTVQFLKKASISDSGAYFWTLKHLKAQNNQEQREDIFISVKEKASTSDDTATSTTTTITVIGVSVGVAVMALAGLIFVMRCKPNKGAQTRGQDHCLTEIDDAGNDHVNEEGMNQVDDTYYTEIFASDELTYAKVNKQAKW